MVSDAADGLGRSGALLVACSASSWLDDFATWSCSALSSLRNVAFSAVTFLPFVTCIMPKILPLTICCGINRGVKTRQTTSCCQ